MLRRLLQGSCVLIASGLTKISVFVKVRTFRRQTFPGILHIYVDKDSPNGNVYVKCPNVTAAYNSVNSLHGRWFSG